MEAQIRLPKMTVKVEGESQTELWDQASAACEVFGEGSCGVCGCEDIVPQTRKTAKDGEEFEYREWVCRNPECRATLSLGVKKKGGGLFPKRKLTESGAPDQEAGRHTKTRGWTRWRGEPKHDQEQPPEPPPLRRPARK